MQVEVIPMLINGDFLNAPLDLKMHLADYKMYGENSCVFQQKELLHGLYECTYLSMNDKELSAEALEYLLKNNKNIGEALSNVYGIERKDILSTLSTMQAVAASSTAMQAVASSSTAMQAILASSTAMQAILASSTAMQAVAASSTAMQAVASSSTAMTFLSTSPLRRRVNPGQKAVGLILPMSLGGNVYFNKVDDINKYGRIEYVDKSLQSLDDGWVQSYTNWGDLLRQKQLGANLVRVYDTKNKYTNANNWIDIILILGTIMTT